MITVETLTKLGACPDGLAWFKGRYPDGLSLEAWTREEQVAALRNGGGRWLMWGVDRNLLPWWSMLWANLRGADLSGANLRGADLNEADLRGANLRWADLSGANLRWADLSGADLTGAYLRGADLSGADLTGAYLSEAIVCNHTVAPEGFTWPETVTRVED